MNRFDASLLVSVAEAFSVLDIAAQTEPVSHLLDQIAIELQRW
jgi:hypothetical protein